MSRLPKFFFPIVITVGILCGGTLPASAGNGIAEDAQRQCIQGAVVGSLTGWAIALIGAPLSGGATLAMMPTIELLIAGGTAGCLLNASGAIAAEAAVPRKR